MALGAEPLCEICVIWGAIPLINLKGLLYDSLYIRLIFKQHYRACHYASVTIEVLH